MKTEKEIKEELKKRKEEIMNYFLGMISKTDIGGNISLARRKDVINVLRWVLNEVKNIEVTERGHANLSKLK